MIERTWQVDAKTTVLFAGECAVECSLCSVQQSYVLIDSLVSSLKQ